MGEQGQAPRAMRRTQSSMTYLRRAGTVVIPRRPRQFLARTVRRLRHAGLARFCPCCGSHLREFKTFGVIPRPEALCPVCGSLERHRLICLYMRRRTDLFSGNRKRMLHVAPEAELSRLFQEAEAIEYLSADLSSPTAMVKMDVTDIHYPDNSFDVIYCSHVLEHVADDTAAMREFHRVLKPGGWAVLQVPISGDTTFEDDTVTSPEVREKLFGQRDHVRRYGKDYAERLALAGFSVLIDGFARELTDQEITRFGLLPSEDVYFCTKPTERVKDSPIRPQYGGPSGACRIAPPRRHDE
jgi:SAM-dependent methyltransferase